MKRPNLAALATAVVAFLLTFAGSQAYAQLNSPVPSSAYIVYEGLDWAWGGPCPDSGGCYATGDLSYQGTQGWQLPSAADMAIVDAADSVDPSTFAYLFLNNPGGNVPNNGTDPVSGSYFAQGPQGSVTSGSCAAAYFTVGANWCDSVDGVQGIWSGSAIAANNGEQDFSEQLYVKGGVPESSTWAMMILGFVGLGFAGYRATRKTVAAAI